MAAPRWRGSRRGPTLSRRGHRYSDHTWPCQIRQLRHLLCCEPLFEERSAGNPHATFCGSRGRATASGDPVRRHRSLKADIDRHLALIAPQSRIPRPGPNHPKRYFPAPGPPWRRRGVTRGPAPAKATTRGDHEVIMLRCAAIGRMPGSR